MLKRVRHNYMKVLLPLIAVCLLLGALLLIISNFGFVYIFSEPKNIDEMAIEEFDGSYAKIEINRIEGTYARYGSEAVEGQEVDIVERYCAYVVDGDKYIGIRIMGGHLDDVQAMYDAFEAFGVNKAREMDFGYLSGTLNHYEKVDENLYAYLSAWVKDEVFPEISPIANPFKTEEDNATPEEVAYLSEHVLPYILEVDYMGEYTNNAIYIMTIIAALFFLAAVILVLSIVFGLWDRPAREFIASVGREAAEEHFAAGKSFGPSMHMGQEYIWWFKKVKTEILKICDVIWAYPRSKRLEGGKLRWSIILKTEDKREYNIVLKDKDFVQAALETIEAEGHFVATGFDRQKQQLYEKDVNEFKTFIKNKKGVDNG